MSMYEGLINTLSFEYKLLYIYVDLFNNLPFLIYIYIYREREREGESESVHQWSGR